MIFLNIIMLVLLVCLLIPSLIRDRRIMDTIDRKEHKLYFLYPMAQFLARLLNMDKHFHRKNTIKEALRAIHVGKSSYHLMDLYLYGKISIIILVTFLFNLLSLLYHLEDMGNQIIKDGGYLERPAIGEGSTEIGLNAYLNRSGPMEEKGGEKVEEDTYLQDIAVKIEEKQYTSNELEQAFDNAKKYLDRDILGNNDTLDYIDEDLHFCKNIPGAGIDVIWKPEDISLVSRSGKVHNEAVETEGVVTIITAELNYKDEKIEYIIPCRIMPRSYSNEEQIQIALDKELQNASDETKYDSMFRLPDTIEGYDIEWREVNGGTGAIIWILGVVLALLMWFQEDKNLEKKVGRRNQQMLLDYPDIINKFILLINAGMTVKQAWIKVTEDYERKRRIGNGIKRYAYEELLITARELKLGISESEAYEQFAKRAGLISYMKFGSLIAQNLRKGNKGLVQLLGNEAMEAFEERKETAKRLGEEAGTKLLAPMMLMLIIVLAIILIPAFISFGI